MAFANDTFDLGKITVFANKAGQQTKLSRTGASVEIITTKQLRQAPEKTVAEYLARLPGLSLSANGGLGANTTLRVRGLDGKYIKVLVDGIDVTDPSSTQTQFDWGGLTTSQISRIEVLKGSSSSIYGSRAIAGVVNITTDQRTRKPGTTVSGFVEGGSFNTVQAGMNVAKQGKRGGMSISLNRIKTKGFSAHSGAANTEPDGYDATKLNFSGDYKVSDTLTFGFSGLALNSRGSFDEFSGDGLPPYDEFTTVKTRALRGFAKLQTGAVKNTFSTSYYINDRVSHSNGFATPFSGTRSRLDYTGVYASSNILTYTFGTDWEKETFNSGTDRGQSTIAGAFGEVLYAPNAALDLASSLRFDSHSAFGGNLSGRLSSVYRLSGATTLRAVASTGFRAPSLYELNSTLYGNTALNPEASTTLELGVEQQLGGGSFIKATGFYTEINNLIQFVTLSSFPAPFTGQYQQVVGKSVSKGIELSGEWVLSDKVNLFGNYTYTDATDATGARLLRVPTNDLVMGLGAQINANWKGNVSVRYVADRPSEFGTVMPDYSVVNASVSYAVSDRAELYLRVENLFDADYQTSANFNASRRAFYAGLRANF
ncbi:MAG: TonB-dependent receptor [Alphaproteobacteria bacterium]|nr:TonB-dependent receptor [Alphaproteobacteria bacterium]